MIGFEVKLGFDRVIGTEKYLTYGLYRLSKPHLTIEEVNLQ